MECWQKLKKLLTQDDNGIQLNLITLNTNSEQVQKDFIQHRI